MVSTDKSVACRQTDLLMPWIHSYDTLCLNAPSHRPTCNHLSIPGFFSLGALFHIYYIKIQWIPGAPPTWPTSSQPLWQMHQTSAKTSLITEAYLTIDNHVVSSTLDDVIVCHETIKCKQLFIAWVCHFDSKWLNQSAGYWESPMYFMHWLTLPLLNILFAIRLQLEV